MVTSETLDLNQLTQNKNTTYWSIAYWTLFVCWVVGAGLNMYRVHGGFFTNYLADLTFPPYFYIVIRGLYPIKRGSSRISVFVNWFGDSPERALISIFLVGVITEVKTLYWPTGIIRGTFDPLDILAYAVGLLICYFFDRRRSHLLKNKDYEKSESG